MATVTQLQNLFSLFFFIKSDLGKSWRMILQLDALADWLIFQQDIMCPMTMASSTSSATSPTKGKSGEPAHPSSSGPAVRQQTSSWLWRMNATLTSWWSPPKLAFWRYSPPPPPPATSQTFTIYHFRGHISFKMDVKDSDVEDELLKGLSAAFTVSEL